MDGIEPVRQMKETDMFNTKAILTAVSLAVLSAAGIGSAAAGPWERHEARIEHRAFVDRARVAQALRFHRYRVIGNPYFVGGRYVVRAHDRFGRIVFVQVDPRSGVFLREVIL